MISMSYLLCSQSLRTRVDGLSTVYLMAPKDILGLLYLKLLQRNCHLFQNILVDNLDPTMAEAHLLMAQIQVHEGNYLSAQQNLEVGLSYNFEVRDHPIFHLINAKVQKDQGNIEDAEKTLKKALELALKDLEASKKGPKQNDGKKIAFTTADLATIYLELADR